MVQLDEKREARVGKLSGGQKQRLALACALIGDPDFSFLMSPRRALIRSRAGIVGPDRGIEKQRPNDFADYALHGRSGKTLRPRGRSWIAAASSRWTRRDELIASLGVEQMVEYATAGATLEPSVLTKLQGVRAVSSLGNLTQLQVAELHQTLPALLDTLAERGIPLTELRTHSATLEDVFVSLTGRHLRDE